MKKTWVVAAESSRARVFLAESRVKPMREWEGMANPKARSRVLDINADNAGHVHDRMGQARHLMESEVDPKKHEAEVFAKEIAEYLEKMRATGRFEELVLVAAPEFLGMLRKHMTPASLKLVARAVSKNLVRDDEAAIRKAALELE
ncbi:host attachment protein [Methylohalobius crimeensis]|uniref:host attachment protein n=1 Tax=Methylohalobius crimeensis TaxID=244365 RepID=UPI0003B61C8A|nr:host attachment protein [Methylohalobius crimeensis]